GRFRKRYQGRSRLAPDAANCCICERLRTTDPGPNVEESGQTLVMAMRRKPSIRSDSSPDEARTAPAPARSTSRWAAWKRPLRARSLSRVQAAIGTVAGIVSITGAAFSVVQTARPANTGDVVAIVQTAGTRLSVPDATIEVLTTENALVATMTPDASGRARQ